MMTDQPVHNFIGADANAAGFNSSAAPYFPLQPIVVIHHYSEGGAQAHVGLNSIPSWQRGSVEKGEVFAPNKTHHSPSPRSLLCPLGSALVTGTPCTGAAVGAGTVETRPRAQPTRPLGRPTTEASVGYRGKADKILVNHEYHDFSRTSLQECMSLHSSKKPAREFSSQKSFPKSLHLLLEFASSTGKEKIISWCPHGRAFIVYRPKDLMEKIVPLFYPNQTKYQSFLRQLNVYGFKNLTRHGPDRGAYYHVSAL